MRYYTIPKLFMRETQGNKSDTFRFYPPDKKRKLEIDVNISLINFLKGSILITKIGIKRIYRSNLS